MCLKLAWFSLKGPTSRPSVTLLLRNDDSRRHCRLLMFRHLKVAFLCMGQPQTQEEGGLYLWLRCSTWPCSRYHYFAAWWTLGKIPNGTKSSRPSTCTAVALLESSACINMCRNTYKCLNVKYDFDVIRRWWQTAFPLTWESRMIFGNHQRQGTILSGLELSCAPQDIDYPLTPPSEFRL